MPPEVSFSLQNVTAVCEMVSSQAYLCEKKYSRAGMNAIYARLQSPGLRQAA